MELVGGRLCRFAFLLCLKLGGATGVAGVPLGIVGLRDAGDLALAILGSGVGIGLGLLAVILLWSSVIGIGFTLGFLVVLLVIFHVLFTFLGVRCVFSAFIAINLGPWVLLLPLTGLEVDVDSELLSASGLHRHLVGQLDSLESALGAVTRAEVPGHHLEVCPVQLFGDTSSILY